MTTYTRGRTLPPIDLYEPMTAPPVGIATTSEGLDAMTLWEVSRLQVAVIAGANNDPVFNAWRATVPAALGRE
jgi:hypothetical protein